MDVLSTSWPDGGYKRPRALEVAAALNRVRVLKMKQKQQGGRGADNSNK